MSERAQRQKMTEEAWARQAALKLNECWELFPREGPDFEVKSATGVFGLEVTECQIGLQTRNGSVMRAVEGGNRKSLEEVRQKYERTTGIYLNLKYLGPINCLAMDELFQALQGASLQSLELYAISVQISLPSGKVFVHRTTNPQWIVVRDRVGWVSDNGKFLQREIDKKAHKQADYRKVFSDVRLLVVADRTHKSGKLILENDFSPDLQGFDAVYFFSYPDSVSCFFHKLD